jgi:hypothetical protein
MLASPRFQRHVCFQRTAATEVPKLAPTLCAAAATTSANGELSKALSVQHRHQFPSENCVTRPLIAYKWRGAHQRWWSHALLSPLRGTPCSRPSLTITGAEERMS